MTMGQNGSEVVPPDVDRIMEQIRLRIETKKKTGQYASADMEELERMTLHIDPQNAGDDEGDLQYQLSQINYHCDTARPPELSSHRKRLGTLIVGFKKCIRRLSEPYIQMVLKRQVAFNVEMVRLLNQVVLDFRYRGSSQEKQLAQLEKRWEQTIQSLESIPQELRLQKSVFEEVLAELKEMKKQPAETGRSLDTLKARVRSTEYVRFEDRHRGSQEEIKWKQRNYLPYFKDKGPVVDVGCGRGEFLELLREAGIPASGVDTNPEMVDQCLTKGLKVFHGEGLDYLRGLPDQSLGGIFLSQVIEHLDHESLRELVRVSLDKLLRGGILLAETINPQCLSTFSGAFYLDLSHQNPIHPEAARFLWESLGFLTVEILYVSPYPQEMKLLEMVRREDDSYEDELARVLNENIRRLNSLLYGFQDYAVLGVK